MGVIKSRAEVDNNVVHINRTVISDGRGELEGLISKESLCISALYHGGK